MSDSLGSPIVQDNELNEQQDDVFLELEDINFTKVKEECKEIDKYIADYKDTHDFTDEQIKEAKEFCKLSVEDMKKYSQNMANIAKQEKKKSEMYTKEMAKSTSKKNALGKKKQKRI